jgi:putative aldouronate transport system permease protein
MTAKSLRQQLPLHIMLLPAVILLIIFSYIPMAGIVIAFQNFIPAKGLFGQQEWVGLANFKYIFSLPETWNAIRNTVSIALMKIILGQITPILISLLLNEIRKNYYKKAVQTLIYLPYFLSWVILGGILQNILSTKGMLNNFLSITGIEPIFFLGNAKIFPYVLVVTDVWKNFGFNTIIYLASLTAIDTGLYEAAIIDGANRFKQVIHVTIPGIMPIIILMAAMSLGNILNAGFEQVFNLYNPTVYETGDIIDTLVYRIGMLNAQYSVSTAIGLFKSAISGILISVSYYLAYKLADYRIF